MPSIKQGIRRICAIYQMVSANPYQLTKLDIQRRLEDITGEEICVSSIEKDFFALRMDFDVNLRYSRRHEGYYIENDKPFMFMENLFYYIGINDLIIVQQILNACKTIS